ncbi:MAG: ATP-binding cassette domain-containing protein [Opitutales bacterium]|nr:ATP-binding cassette domain-containing protein [Opitutales bacterium]
MPLLTIHNLSLAFGADPLFDAVSADIEAGERIGLVGRNGCGKSTFLRCLAGQMEPDEGEIRLSPGHSAGYLPQEVSFPEAGVTVEEVVFSDQSAAVHEDWQLQAAWQDWVEAWELSPQAPFADLSAGVKRKVWLARAMLRKPDLLLLDEPTNHLDIKAIEWLEERLRSHSGAMLMVTHDRVFLQNTCNRIYDLDRGHLTTWDCSYESYLRRKEKLEEEEAARLSSLQKELKKEEAWLKQGVKARRTRNQGRLRALVKLREKRRNWKEKQGTARISLETGEYSGEKVAVFDKVEFGYGDGDSLVENFTFRLSRGDRLGIVGPNGVGKSTLIRLLLGHLEPRHGGIVRGTQWQPVYFDQLRETFNEEETVFWNIGGGADFVSQNGQKKHVLAYLKEFLFPPEQVMSPVKSLSGGEKNRLLLARLFLQPANLLVLDEPTNDLDMETIELLEEVLHEYSGTLVLISHDRKFLDNLVTDLLVFEGVGQIRQVVGGYSDYLAGQKRKSPSPGKAESAGKAMVKKGYTKAKPRKFLNRERRELDEIPQQLETLEAEQEKIAKVIASPETYKDDQGQGAADLQKQWDALEEKKNQFYQRWEELEALREELEGTT